MAQATLRVGTSGWQYADWRGAFYPPGLPQRLWLEYFADVFATVEVNNAFYRLPERSTFQQWRERTPDDFTVAVKMSRFLTHIRRLRDPAEPVARFLGRADALGPRLGPVLVQLPPTMRVDVAALERVLVEFGDRARVVVEPRHPSWFSTDVRDLLTAHGAALAWADRLGRPVGPLWRTADFGYLRFHEGRANPRPRYGASALDSWLHRVGDAFDDGESVFVYFNNDTGAAAIHDACAFAHLAGRRGFGVSRATPARDVAAA
jgi:uncharacterized protein YecE (DUF72 family)